VLYGIAVYFFMSRVVVPLLAAAKFSFSLKMMVIGIVYPHILVWACRLHSLHADFAAYQP